MNAGPSRRGAAGPVSRAVALWGCALLTGCMSTPPRSAAGDAAMLSPALRVAAAPADARTVSDAPTPSQVTVWRWPESADAAPKQVLARMHEPTSEPAPLRADAEWQYGLSRNGTTHAASVEASRGELGFALGVTVTASGRVSVYFISSTWDADELLERGCAQSCLVTARFGDGPPVAFRARVDDQVGFVTIEIRDSAGFLAQLGRRQTLTVDIGDPGISHRERYRFVPIDQQRLGMR
jgi:hypothetical protein